jgi:hypothetical protein
LTGADLPVVPDDGVEGEEPLDHAGPEPGGGPAAVALEAELALQDPDDRLDPLPEPVREVPGGLLVLAGRADQGQAQVRAGEERLGVLAGQALAGAENVSFQAVKTWKASADPDYAAKKARVEHLYAIADGEVAEIAHTPSNCSWMNRIECQFTALRDRPAQARPGTPR